MNFLPFCLTTSFLFSLLTHTHTKWHPRDLWTHRITNHRAYLNTFFSRLCSIRKTWVPSSLYTLFYVFVQWFLPLRRITWSFLDYISNEFFLYTQFFRPFLFFMKIVSVFFQIVIFSFSVISFDMFVKRKWQTYTLMLDNFKSSTAKTMKWEKFLKVFHHFISNIMKRKSDICMCTCVWVCVCVFYICFCLYRSDMYIYISFVLMIKSNNIQFWCCGCRFGYFMVDAVNLYHHWTKTYTAQITNKYRTHITNALSKPRYYRKSWNPTKILNRWI